MSFDSFMELRNASPSGFPHLFPHSALDKAAEKSSVFFMTEQYIRWFS